MNPFDNVKVVSVAHFETDSQINLIGNRYFQPYFKPNPLSALQKACKLR